MEKGETKMKTYALTELSLKEDGNYQATYTAETVNGIETVKKVYLINDKIIPITLYTIESTMLMHSECDK
jgi:hypothetical protein